MSFRSLEVSSEEPAWWKVACSVLAAFFGVQSHRNYEKDFSSGRFWPYILMGLILALAFVVGVYLLVQFALSFSHR